MLLNTSVQLEIMRLKTSVIPELERRLQDIETDIALKRIELINLIRQRLDKL